MAPCTKRWDNYSTKQWGILYLNFLWRFKFTWVLHQRIQKGSSLLSEKSRWEKIAALSRRCTKHFTLIYSSFWAQANLSLFSKHITINSKCSQVRTKSFQSFLFIFIHFYNFDDATAPKSSWILTLWLVQPRPGLMCVSIAVGKRL